MQAKEFSDTPTVLDQVTIRNEDILLHDSSPTSNAGDWRFRLRHWYRFSALRLLWLEIGSMGHRMRWSLRIRAVKLRRGDAKTRDWMAQAAFLGFGFETTENTRYMQRIETEFPFLTIFERLLLVQAWKSGWETCACMGTSLDESQRYSLVPLTVSPEGVLTILTLDMLKRQWYKSQYESPRHSDPSQSS